MNNLETAVKAIIENHIENYDEPQGFFDDLAHGGCQSGLIGELVYFSDTTKFYETHKEDINELLKETLEMFGSDASPSEVFGDKWDSEDPLAFDTINQNLLAWFAFEETAQRLQGEF